MRLVKERPPVFMYPRCSRRAETRRIAAGDLLIVALKQSRFVDLVLSNGLIGEFSQFARIGLSLFNH